VPGQSDTALGDWYVNRIVFERQPLLLLLSSTSLLPVVTPARVVRALPGRLGAIVAARLRRAGVEPEVITAELRATHPVIVAPTVDRSVLGIMVDFAKAVPYYVGDVRTEQGLARLEDWLAETPCHAALTRDRVVVPNRKAPELLRAAWMRKSQLRTSSAHGVVH
jgi:hypothetical protein